MRVPYSFCLVEDSNLIQPHIVRYSQRLTKYAQSYNQQVKASLDCLPIRNSRLPLT